MKNVKKQIFYLLTIFICIAPIRLSCQINNNNQSQKSEIQKDIDLVTNKLQIRLDSELDTSQYANRKRFVFPFDYGQQYICRYGFGNLPVNKQLLEQLRLCTCKNTEKKADIVYHLYLKNCDNITNDDVCIFTFDKAQKDSSALFVAICHDDGDVMEQVRGRPPTTGTFMVFKREGNMYKLADVGFGKLVAFDFDKNDKLQPIIYGCSRNHTTPYQTVEFDSIYGMEIRLAWDGQHLNANEVIGVTHEDSKDIFSTYEMKRKKIYESVKALYVTQPNDILRGVKIHWRYRSFSLKARYTEEDRQSRRYYSKFWKRGFKID